MKKLELIDDGEIINFTARYKSFLRNMKDWHLTHGRANSCNDIEENYCPFQGLTDKSLGNFRLCGCLEKVVFILDQFDIEITKTVIEEITKANSGENHCCVCSNPNNIKNLCELVIKYCGGPELEIMEIE